VHQNPNLKKCQMESDKKFCSSSRKCLVIFGRQIWHANPISLDWCTKHCLSKSASQPSFDASRTTCHWFSHADVNQQNLRLPSETAASSSEHTSQKIEAHNVRQMCCRSLLKDAETLDDLDKSWNLLKSSWNATSSLETLELCMKLLMLLKRLKCPTRVWLEQKQEMFCTHGTPGVVSPKFDQNFEKCTPVRRALETLETLETPLTLLTSLETSQIVVETSCCLLKLLMLLMLKKWCIETWLNKTQLSDLANDVCCMTVWLTMLLHPCSLTAISIETCWNSSLIKTRAKKNLSHSAMSNHSDSRMSFKLFSELEKGSSLPWNGEGILKPFFNLEKGHQARIARQQRSWCILAASVAWWKAAARSAPDGNVVQKATCLVVRRLFQAVVSSSGKLFG